ncbi:MAG TPA: hypothetical protein V6C65_02340 [Allocoleopsis sp.]
MTQAALQLVSKVRPSKRPSKTDKIVQLENQHRELNEQIDAYKGLLNTANAKIHTLENPEQSEVVEAVKKAFRKQSRIGAFWGLIKGGFPPIASFVVAHQEIPKVELESPRAILLCCLVFGALLFSAPTVYEWCKAAFHNSAKAVGFVVLLEGVMVFSHVSWLGYSALALLISINAIQSACNLATRQEKNEFQF